MLRGERYVLWLNENGERVKTQPYKEEAKALQAGEKWVGLKRSTKRTSSKEIMMANKPTAAQAKKMLVFFETDGPKNGELNNTRTVQAFLARNPDQTYAELLGFIEKGGGKLPGGKAAIRRVRWACYALRDAGLAVKDDDDGTWALTDEGIEDLEGEDE
jgi:hypothetical protein